MASGPSSPPRLMSAFSSARVGPGLWPGLAIVLHLHQRPISTGADEGDDLTNERVVLELRGHGFGSLAKRAGPEEQLPVGVAQAMHLGPRDTAPAQADDIEPNQRGALSEREAERDQI